MQNNSIGPALANISMIELETSLIPSLSRKLSSWKGDFDDSICFSKKDSLKLVLDNLNKHHKNIKFTFEQEIDEKIRILVVLLIRNNRYIVTTVYRKKKNTNIYLNWNSLGLDVWIWGTLRTIVTRAFEVC